MTCGRRFNVPPPLTDLEKGSGDVVCPLLIRLVLDVSSEREGEARADATHEGGKATLQQEAHQASEDEQRAIGKREAEVVHAGWNK